MYISQNKNLQSSEILRNTKINLVFCMIPYQKRQILPSIQSLKLKQEKALILVKKIADALGFSLDDLMK